MRILFYIVFLEYIGISRDKKVHFRSQNDLNNYNILRYHHLCHNIFDREDSNYEEMLKNYLFVGDLIAKARNYRDIWEWYNHILSVNASQSSTSNSRTGNNLEPINSENQEEKISSTSNSQTETNSMEESSKENSHGMLVLGRSHKIIAM